MSKITVIVTGETGSGKSAIAGEIEIALKAIGVPVTMEERDTMVVADYQNWIDLYKPEVTIIERNIPIVSLRFKRCPACSRTDQQYKVDSGKVSHAALCGDPWHSPDSMRRRA